MGKRDNVGRINYQMAYDGFPTVPQNDWTHLGDSFDGVDYRQYVNGVLRATSQPSLPTFVPSAEFRIGRSGQFELFKGLIDDVRIFNRALSAAEIQADFVANLVLPATTAQPASQSAVAGNNVTFTVVATGGAPLRYQWRFNGANIAGATTASYTRVNLRTDEVGDYSVVVTNAAGSVTSDSAVLTVSSAPVAQMPAGLIRWWTGDGHAYDVVGTNHGTLQGVTAYVPGLVGQAFGVNGSYVSIPTSPSLTLTSGAPFTLEAWVYRTNTGLPFHVLGKRDTTANYFYQMGYDGSDSALPTSVWTHLAHTYDGVTDRRYLNGTLVKSTAQGPTTNAPTTEELRIGFSGPYGGFSGLIDDVRVYNRALASIEVQTIAAAGSAGMVLNANPPSITSQPVSQSVLVGNGVTFSVSADGSLPLFYQWRSNGVNMTGATSATLILTSVQTNAADSYTVVVTNSAGSVTSQLATLTITNTLLSHNGLPAPMGLTAWWTGDGTANDRTGVNHGSLQNGASYGAGKVNQTFTLDGLNDYVSVPDSAAWAFGANEFSIELWANFAATAGDMAFISHDEGGGTAKKWIFWRTGGQLGFHFGNGAGSSAFLASPIFTPTLGQWYHLGVTRSGSVFTFFINGAPVSTNSSALEVSDGNAQLTLGQAENGFFFNGLLDEVRIYNRALALPEMQSIYQSGTNGMRLPAGPSITNHPQSQTVLVGNGVTFSVQADGSTPLFYQWQSNGVNVAGATNATLSFNNLQTSEAASYSVVVTNSVGRVSSANAVLTVNAPPAITDGPGNVTVLVTSNATFSVTAAGTAPLFYQWFFDAINALADATNASLTVSNAQPANEGSYQVVVTNVAGSVTSVVAVLTVLVPPSVTSQPTNLTVSALTDATFTVTSGGTPPFAYQWEKDGVPVGGGTGAALTLNAVTTNAAGGYRVVITNVAGAVTSSVAALTVNRLVQLITFGSRSAKRVDAAPFSLSATATSGLSVSYISSNPDVATVSGNTVTIWGIGSTAIMASQAGNATYLPGGDVSQTLIVTGIPPSVTSQPASVTVSVTFNAVFSVTATGTAPLSYQWRKDGLELAGQIATTLTLTNVVRARSGLYSVAVSNVVGTAASSNALLRVLVSQRFETNSVRRLPDGRFHVVFGDFDNSPLNATNLINFEVHATTNFVNWVTLTNGFTIIGGQVQVDDTDSPNLPRRFYRVLER